ncbi:hypothetical protein [Candidatus Poriferisodalis sp.]|uniref:hypothetical protein n=1 Tax=Candidatus Poriferisodalis sp. TaxID=3101277 RepID=UPI003B018CAC
MQEQPDTATAPPEQSRWQRLLMRPRDRSERLAAILITFPAAVLTCFVVMDLVRESYPVPSWFTPLAIPFILGVVTAHAVWYWRRTPATAAS